MKVVLLPGMDGTGELFDPFVESAPGGYSTQVVCYPRDEPLDYGACVDLVRSLLPVTDDYLLLAESFSGPIAIRLAAESPPALRGLILCNTFAHRPWWPSFRLLPWAAIFSRPIPRPVTRHLLGATSEDSTLEERFRSIVSTVQPQVLARRLREIMTVDATTALKSIRVPVLYLRGTKDLVVRRRCLSYIQSHKGDVRLTELPVGHLLFQVAPIEAWQAVEKFMTDTVDHT